MDVLGIAGISGMTGQLQTQLSAAEMGLARATLDQEKKLAQELYATATNVVNTTAATNAGWNRSGTGKIIDKLA